MLRTVGDAVGALVPAVRLGLVVLVVRVALVVPVAGIPPGLVARGADSPLALRRLELAVRQPARLPGRVALAQAGDGPGEATPVALSR